MKANADLGMVISRAVSPPAVWLLVAAAVTSVSLLRRRRRGRREELARVGCHAKPCVEVRPESSVVAIPREKLVWSSLVKTFETDSADIRVPLGVRFREDDRLEDNDAPEEEDRPDAEDRPEEEDRLKVEDRLEVEEDRCEH